MRVKRLLRKQHRVVEADEGLGECDVHALVAAQVERPARGRLLGRGRPLVEVPGVSLGAAGGAREA